jgi:hypothetical protein
MWSARFWASCAAACSYIAAESASAGSRGRNEQHLSESVNGSRRADPAGHPLDAGHFFSEELPRELLH